jgi:hypothetical protein
MSLFRSSVLQVSRPLEVRRLCLCSVFGILPPNSKTDLHPISLSSFLPLGVEGALAKEREARGASNGESGQFLSHLQFEPSGDVVTRPSFFFTVLTVLL